MTTQLMTLFLCALTRSFVCFAGRLGAGHPSLPVSIWNHTARLGMLGSTYAESQFAIPSSGSNLYF